MVFVHVCMHVHEYLFVGVYTFLCVMSAYALCARKQKSEENIRYHLSCVFRQCLLLAWNLANRLGWQTSESQGVLLVSISPELGLEIYASVLCVFTWVLRTVYLQGKYFARWAILQPLGHNSKHLTLEFGNSHHGDQFFKLYLLLL